jgi:fatty acid elongase 3
MMQIIQFVIDVFVVYMGSMFVLVLLWPGLTRCTSAYMHFASRHYNDILPNLGNCAGSKSAAIFGCSLISVYLGLFINFYIQTYKKPAKGKKLVANGNVTANGNGLVVSYCSSVCGCGLKPLCHPLRIKRE